MPRVQCVDQRIDEVLSWRSWASFTTNRMTRMTRTWPKVECCVPAHECLGQRVRYLDADRSGVIRERLVFGAVWPCRGVEAQSRAQRCAHERAEVLPGSAIARRDAHATRADRHPCSGVGGETAASSCLIAVEGRTEDRSIRSAC